MRNLLERATMIAVLATALVASGASHARAAFMTYTETSTVSGSLGSTTFTGATITLTQTADTANVVFNPMTQSLYLLDTTSTLSITGGGLASPLSASFVSKTFTASNATFTYGGLVTPFARLPAFNIAVLEVYNAAFATYDLTTMLGPISGDSRFNAGQTVGTTTAGDLILNEAGTVTFQAVVTAATVPEPSSLVLGSFAGVIGLAIAARRRLGRFAR